LSESRGVVLVLILAAMALASRPAQSTALDAPPIAQLPYTIGGWSGFDDASLDPETAALLGADAYLTRTYSAGTGADISMYIAYYGAQRPGVSIHSPLHCLPGTGWEPVDVATVPVGSGSVRRVTMQKNLDRVAVIYWYQLQGRTVAGELESKVYGLFDRVRRGRSDAALVRLVVPIADDSSGAAERGLSFAGELLPQLAPLL
jgi:EpsI family protein